MCSYFSTPFFSRKKQNQMSSCCGWACVTQSNVGIVESLGQFADVIPPGCSYIGCLQNLRGEVSLRTRLMHVQNESSTEDRVILTVRSVIMYHVIPSECHTAFYSLSSLNQIRSYIESALRSEVARVKYENIFIARQQIAESVRKIVAPELSQRGFEVDELLIREIVVPYEIRSASEKQLEMRYVRQANRYRAEADKIAVTVNAQAEAEVKRLQGVGSANMQVGLAGGFGDLIGQWNGGERSSELIAMILMQQYFDTIQKVSRAESDCHTIFVPHQSLMPKIMTPDA